MDRKINSFRIYTDNQILINWENGDYIANRPDPLQRNTYRAIYINDEDGPIYFKNNDDGSEYRYDEWAYEKVHQILTTIALANNPPAEELAEIERLEALELLEEIY